MKPCPNPVCKTPQPRVEAKNLVIFYVVCRHCGMRGPKSVKENNAIRLWELLPRQPEDSEAGIVGKLFFVEAPNFEGDAEVLGVSDDDTVRVRSYRSGAIYTVDKAHLTLPTP